MNPFPSDPDRPFYRGGGGGCGSSTVVSAYGYTMPVTPEPLVPLYIQDQAAPVGYTSARRKHICQMIPVRLLLTDEHVADLCATCGREVKLTPEPRTTLDMLMEADTRLRDDHGVRYRSRRPTPSQVGIAMIILGVILQLAAWLL